MVLPSNNKYVLFLFLDGVGLGSLDPSVNPFISASTPTLDHLLAGKKLAFENSPIETDISTLIGLDAQLGIEGTPQSATGQATLVTGINFAQRLGQHYGPKPNFEIRSFFKDGTKSSEISGKGYPSNDLHFSIFSKLKNQHKKTCLLNAYPPIYFKSTSSGKRFHSVFPLAATEAGIRLFDQDDLFAGKALSADFTGKGWVEFLKIKNTPLITPYEAGERMAIISMAYDFSMFEYWESDVLGHKQDLTKAKLMLERLDQVLTGLLSRWDLAKGIILITSDHGNMEDLSTRKHTHNQVPGLIIGPAIVRKRFSDKVRSILDITPFIMDYLLD